MIFHYQCTYMQLISRCSDVEAEISVFTSTSEGSHGGTQSLTLSSVQKIEKEGLDGLDLRVTEKSLFFSPNIYMFVISIKVKFNFFRAADLKNKIENNST